MVRSGADLFNVDHLVPFEEACRVYGGARKCFKGNLDPVRDVLNATPEACRAKARACLARAAGLPYMLSAGCEIPAAVPDAVFRAFCGAAG
jgi:uroporphyrinogen-III decarboxylase